MSQAIDDALAQRVDAFLLKKDTKAGSLIVSIFGDAILPRGGVVWLGSLISLLAPFGVNERLTRTAAFRLVKDDWLVQQPDGRRSNYALSPIGRLRFEKAAHRIYAVNTPPWDGQWRLLSLSPHTATSLRDALRRSLFWQGFGQLSGYLFVHPSAAFPAVFAALEGDGLQLALPHLMPFAARNPGLPGLGSDRDVVASAWDLEKLGQDYAAFCTRYRSIHRAVQALNGDERGNVPDEALAFKVRAMLIHDFRRLLLRDPELPDALLPQQWPGLEARALTRAVYRFLLPASERFLSATLCLANGSPLKQGKRIEQRFLPSAN